MNYKILTSSCEQQNKNEIAMQNAPGKNFNKTKIAKSKFFISSKSNAVKLQLTNSNIVFSNYKQPLETEASILVNPSIQHRTLLGIGAALIDAAAETFYKLSIENLNQLKL